MPKIVDHAERRSSIISATWRVIARGGLANTTTREIAKEAGCSTGVLAHYFTDRADILTSALIAAHRGVSRSDRPERGRCKGSRSSSAVHARSTSLERSGTSGGSD